MARRRKNALFGGSRKKTISLEIKSSVLREIWGVFYMGLGIFTILSLQKNFGLLGEIWVGFIRPVVGWGIYALPAFFIFMSLLFFFSKKVTFPLSKLLGLFLLMISSLSIVHLSVPMDKVFQVAQQGLYGGYIGFMMNFLFTEILKIGRVGASVAFLLIFVVSLLLTFEISLVAVLRFLKPDIRLVRVKEKDKDLKILRDGGRFDEEDEDESELEDEDMGNLEEEDIVKKIDAIPDSEFGMPVNYENEPTLQIRRAQITPAEENKEKIIGRKIQIKDESQEALTSEEKEEGYEWKPPSLDLLAPSVPDISLDDAFLNDNAAKIKAKLDQFGIKVTMHEVHVGPTVVQYTLKPHEGVKLSKITTLKNDLALALAATAVRIEAPIPGKSLVGIEVPNEKRSIVHLREILESKDFSALNSKLSLPLGRDVAGKPMCGDLASMPHLLIAGATGSGKSVGMNTFLVSLLYQNAPSDLRLILIDPKRVELTGYNGIPHLLTPVITDPEKAAIALRWAVAEMNRRYQLCSEYRCRNIADYNALVAEEKAKAEEEVVKEPAESEEGISVSSTEELEFLDSDLEADVTEKKELPQKMPNIIIVIDELADLMMAAGKEVEASICRIAQMARAVGMHLVVATQRPSVDVITGLIKANIPARIAFAVSSSIDSRTILDSIGAEDLLGKGDMLYLPGGMSRPVRIQGIYVSSKEIERVVNNIKVNGEPQYVEDIISSRVTSERIQGIPDSSIGEGSMGDDDDSMYELALQVVKENRRASASLLQRRLKVGYARAARLLDLMEQNGAIGPVNGAKPRQIFVE